MASEQVDRYRGAGKTLRRALSLRQLSVLLLIAALLATVDRLLAASILLGGLAFAVPHCWYTWYVLGDRGFEASPQQIFRRFQRGEMQKLIMTAVLCALVFATVRPLNDAGFFLAFLAMMMLSWVNAARLAHVTDQV